MVGFQLTLYGRIWVIPEAVFLTGDQSEIKQSTSNGSLQSFRTRPGNLFNSNAIARFCF
jgi:hypothetical protein